MVVRSAGFFTSGTNFMAIPCFPSASRRDIERKVEGKGEAKIRDQVLSREVKNSHRFRSTFLDPYFRKPWNPKGGSSTLGSYAQNFLLLFHESSLLFYTFYLNRRRNGNAET